MAFAGLEQSLDQKVQDKRFLFVNKQRISILLEDVPRLYKLRIEQDEPLASIIHRLIDEVETK